MINFDSLTLKALMQELEPMLSPGRVQRVQQPGRHEILLSIRAHGKNHKLYISVNPKYPHVAVLTDKGKELRHIEIPQKPPMFCMLLRKYMEGTRILRINQPKHERILEIYFESYNELGAKIPLVLACEFMGKYSNIVLYNYENNVIAGCAHNVGPEKSRERELAGGLPYIYPPRQNKINLLNLNEEEFFQQAKALSMPINTWLNRTFFDISLAMANELCELSSIIIKKDEICSITKERISVLYNKARDLLLLKDLTPCISSDKKIYSIFNYEENQSTQLDSVNTMVDEYFGHYIFEDKFGRLKASLYQTLKKSLDRVLQRIKDHSKNLTSYEKIQKYKQYGDIIMANLYQIEQGVDNVELYNFFDENKPVKIILDPLLSASVNAQKYYKRYNKAKNAIKISQEILEGLESEKKYLESIQVSINQAHTFDDLFQIQEELYKENIVSLYQQQVKRDKKSSKKIELLTYKSSDGYDIYVGKNNKQNDYIVQKLSSPLDIWLHTQEIPGSHVLIKIISPDTEIPETTIHEAANIAACYSQAGQSSNVPVVYTRRKFVKKPSGSKPGFVIYTHEKTLFVNPDKEVIA